MNKRQRKKQCTRYMQREVEVMKKFSAPFFNERMCRMRLLLHPHRRRHWMSKAEHQHRKETLLVELAAEKAAFKEKIKTHHNTLGGWIPKKIDGQQQQ